MSIIAKYKFDKTIYADLLPEFNAEFTSDKYNTTDEEVDGIITRTIESDELPTLMRFGRVWVEGESSTDNRTDSLLEVLDLNTSGLTSCSNMFRYNKNLISITCEWDTSNVTNMQYMFVDCTNLASLDTSNFNTSNATDMFGMFFNCYNLTSLDLSNFDTSKVTTMSNMFFNCNKLTSLNVSNFDTSKVTDMQSMFYNCNKLTSLDVSNFDTSKVTNMNNLFDCCLSLTEIHGISNWDTSNVTNMVATFGKCESLIELNLSGWDISSVTNADNLFGQCFSLVTLDISNFKFSTNCIITNIFNENLGNIPLADIGMLYCDQSTINKVASLLPTDITQTIWIEDVDVKDLTPIEGVEFKQYAKNTEIMLTSPLLEGDKLIVKDGKLYHWHKMWKVVLNGSEDWMASGLNTNMNTNFAIYIHKPQTFVPKLVFNNNTMSNMISDRFRVAEPSLTNNYDLTNEVLSAFYKGDDFVGQIRICINKSRLSTQDVYGFKQWLQANPTTVVYELASPYYELISEDPLTISLIAESSDITNSSNIPLNMTINNKGLSTVAMSPSTTYTVAFDKNTDNEVVVNLCGNEITTTDNIVEITTPSEIDDELIFYGDGIEVSNVRLLEGSVSGDSIPRETFEGLKNSFEDGYIPENKIANIQPNLNNVSTSTQYRWDYKTANDGITVCTVYTTEDNISLPYRRKGIVEWIENVGVSKGISVYIAPEGMEFYGIQKDYGTTLANPEPFQAIVLEGDWTHLTEEDWNNLGKYKVEYKVTGKNKFDINKITTSGTVSIVGNRIHMNGTYGACIGKLSDICNLQIGKTYKTKFSYNVISGDGLNVGAGGQIRFYKKENDSFTSYIFPDNLTVTQDILDNYYILVYGSTEESEFYDIQIEEGTVATEYEPYKSYTKTFYLNSPLLEGDTIEDVNGVATHVKRYEKVVLDGSENSWQLDPASSADITLRFYMNNSGQKDGRAVIICPTFNLKKNYTLANNDTEGIFGSQNGSSLFIDISKSKLSEASANGFKQWLSENPTTVVYELASPIYEPISTESILCDSYVNGHLDFDSAVPVEKVMFKHPVLYLKYLVSNTEYCIKFESDNIGECSIGISGVYYKFNNIVKGINKCSLTTPSNLVNRNITIHGIGFNASNIQVVATDRNADFGYFKGLQSSFEEKTAENLFDESCLSTWWLVTATNIYKTDTSGKYFSIITKAEEGKKYTIKYDYMNRYIYAFLDENYNILRGSSEISMFTTFQAPKNTKYLMCYISSNGIKEEDYDNIQVVENSENFGYEVKCKVVGKNKFTGNNLIQNSCLDNNGSCYTLEGSLTSFDFIDVSRFKFIKISSRYVTTSPMVYSLFDKNKKFIKRDYGQYESSYEVPREAYYLKFTIQYYGDMSKLITDNIQLEEGAVATPYEPYQEYTKTIYLNSPLLKGDTIEVHNGKLCHYHKMGMVVFDGGEDEGWVYDSGWKDFRWNNLSINHISTTGDANNALCDKLAFVNYVTYLDTVNGSCILFNSSGCTIKNYNINQDIETFKKWLQDNPLTVVYKLVEPYYEEITPIQEDLIITSVKEGDLHIDTIVPISSKVTYNVNVQLLTDFEQSIVEQVQATQTTDLQSILDEEIDN